MKKIIIPNILTIEHTRECEDHIIIDFQYNDIEIFTVKNFLEEGNYLLAFENFILNYKHILYHSVNDMLSSLTIFPDNNYKENILQSYLNKIHNWVMEKIKKEREYLIYRNAELISFGLELHEV